MTGNLPVVETFHSLQGEGAHVGRSAFFIRLAGCDVGCSWCDTKHSWNSRNHPEIALEQLEEETETAAKEGGEKTPEGEKGKEDQKKDQKAPPEKK